MPRHQGEGTNNHLLKQVLSMRRWRFFAYIVLMGALSNWIALDIPTVAPFLLGNMAILVIAKRLGHLWGLLAALLCLVPVPAFPYWLTTTAETAFFLFCCQHRQWSTTKSVLVTGGLLFLPFTYWLHLTLASSLGVAALQSTVLLATLAMNAYGAELIVFVAASPALKHQQSLADQLASRITVFSATPCSLLFSILLNVFVGQHLGERHVQAKQHARDLVSHYEQRRTTYLTDIRFAATALSVAPAQTMLAQLLAREPEYLSALITNREGEVIAQRLRDKAVPVSGQRVADREYYKVPQATGVEHLSNSFVGRTLGNDLLFAVSAPLVDQQGEFNGVLEISVDLTKLTEAWNIPLPEYMDALVLDGNHVNVWGTAGLPLGVAIDREETPFFIHRQISAGRIPDSHDDIGFNQTNRDLVISMPLASNGWTVHVISRLDAPLLQYNFYSLMAALGTLLIIAAITHTSRRFARRYTIPLQALLTEVKQFELDERGDYAPINIRGGARELQVLIADFNIMIQRITLVRQQLVLAVAETNRLNDELEDRVRQRTQEIEQKKNEIERLSAAKDRFLATISHELRTPLTSVIGYAENLLAASEEQATRKLIDRILANAQFQLELINDILDTAKLESNKVQLEVLPIALISFISGIVDSLQSRAEQRELQLLTEYCWPLPEQILSDPTRLQQILYNLLSNAMKFTSDGSVTMRVSAPDKRSLQIDVIDTGIGISSEKQSMLFTAFQQADVSTTRQYGGTGLGLYICRQLAGLMKGNITVVSTPGVGSTFALHLPLPNATTACWLTQMPEQSKSLVSSSTMLDIPRLRGKVLVVDDNNDIQDLLAGMVHQTGCEVLKASSGAEAITLCTIQAFDLVLMDRHMPELDGFETARQLRGKNIIAPIISVSADVLTGNRDLLNEFGIQAYLPKPVNRKMLYQLLQQYLPAGAQSAVAVQDDFPEILKPLRAKYVRHLVADQHALASAFERTDYAELKALLHKLKGSSGSFGFHELSKRSEKAERSIKESDLSALSEMLERVYQEIQRIDANHPT